MSALKAAGIVSNGFPFNKRGNAAVAASHLSMWQAIRQHHLPFLVILEDDTAIPSYWTPESRNLLDNSALQVALSSLQVHEPLCDILFLGHNDFMCASDAQTRVSWSSQEYNEGKGEYYFTQPTSMCMSGFFGYVISQAGAEKMVELVHPLSVALDDALRPLYTAGTQRAKTTNDPELYINAFIVQPPLVAHDFEVESERVAVQST